MKRQPRDDGATAVSAVTSVEPLQKCKRQVRPESKKDGPWSKTVRAGACLVFNFLPQAHALKLVHPSITSEKTIKREVEKLRNSINSNIEECAAQNAEFCGCNQLAKELAWPQGIAIMEPRDLTCDEHQVFLQAFGKVFFQGRAIPDINLDNGPAEEQKDSKVALERLAGRFLQLLEGSSGDWLETFGNVRSLDPRTLLDRNILSRFLGTVNRKFLRSVSTLWKEDQLGLELTTRKAMLP
jgi:hypothetical protein